MGDQEDTRPREQLRADHHAVVEGSRAAVDRSRDMLAQQSDRRQVTFRVAAESVPGGPRAHAVADVGDVTSAYGVALCGFPAEHLTLISNFSWDEVDVRSRCAFCAADLEAGTSS